MKHLAIGLALATAVGVTACNAQAYSQYGPQPQGQPGVSVGFSVFYNALSPWGSWVDLDPWGQVWVPSSVPEGWRPYTLGHWVYTEEGWTWVSDFDWGWAAFHYGRWYFDPVYDWVWVPGDVWGPAWVAWRWGDAVVGWAPLPPGAEWEVGLGFTFGDFDALIPQRDWVFCNDRDFDSPHLRRFLTPDRDDARYFDRTRDVTHYLSMNDHVVNRSIDAERIARATGRPVPHFQLRELERPGHTEERAQERALELYRPRFIARGQERPGERPGGEQRGFEQGRERRSGPSAQEMQSFNELQRRHEQEQGSLEARQQAERQQAEHGRSGQPGRRGSEGLAQRQEQERSQLQQRQRQELMPFLQRFPEMLQRQQQEQAQQLRQRQEAERQNLEQRHRREMANPGQQRPNEMRQRQETERRQMEQRQTEERRQMQQRFVQERRQAGSRQQQQSHPQAKEHGHGKGRPH